MDAAGFSCLIGGEVVEWLAEPFITVMEQSRVAGLEWILHAPALADLGDETVGSSRGLTSTIQLAQMAKVNTVIIHPTESRSPHAQSIQKANLVEASWLAESAGVNLIMETQREAPQELKNLLDRISQDLGICANIGSWFSLWQGGSKYARGGAGGRIFKTP